ncbi:hypothetical protein FOZ63_006314, partial [Perkinsus olseni]
LSAEVYCDGQLFGHVLVEVTSWTEGRLSSSATAGRLHAGITIIGLLLPAQLEMGVIPSEGNPACESRWVVNSGSIVVLASLLDLVVLILLIVFVMEPNGVPSYPIGGSVPPPQSSPYVYQPQIPAQAGHYTATAPAGDGPAHVVTGTCPPGTRTSGVGQAGAALNSTQVAQDTSAPLVTITAWEHPASASVPPGSLPTSAPVAGSGQPPSAPVGSANQPLSAPQSGQPVFVPPVSTGQPTSALPSSLPTTASMGNSGQPATALAVGSAPPASSVQQASAPVAGVAQQAMAQPAGGDHQAGLAQVTSKSDLKPLPAQEHEPSTAAQKTASGWGGPSMAGYTGVQLQPTHNPSPAVSG